MIQILDADANPLLIDERAEPAADCTAEVADGGQEGEARGFDTFRTDLRVDDGHGQEDEALADDLRYDVGEDDEEHVGDAPHYVQAQDKDEANGREND